MNRLCEPIGSPNGGLFLMLLIVEADFLIIKHDRFEPYFFNFFIEKVRFKMVIADLKN